MLRRYWLPLALLLAVAVYLAVRPFPSLPGRSGGWRPGDWWLVTTRVPAAHLRKAPTGWVAGATYRFTVEDAEHWRGKDCWRVRLDLVAGDGVPQPLATLYYTRDRLSLAGGRYFGPGRLVVNWPEASAYLPLPVDLPRLDRMAPGRPMEERKQGRRLTAEALDPAPGQTQVWSDQAPWWLRFEADGIMQAELKDASWWQESTIRSVVWRRTLTGPESPPSVGPFSLAPAQPPRPAAAGPRRVVSLSLEMGGHLAGEVREAELSWQPGTYALPLTLDGRAVGILYCSVLDPARARLRLDRVVLNQPEYVDRALSGLEGEWSPFGGLDLAQGDLQVHVERGVLR